jgi:hypothetical protein
MRRRTTPQGNRPTRRPRGDRRRRKTRSQRHVLIGTTLYYYPRTERLAPTLYDPDLRKAVRRGLVRARAMLVPRGSDWVIGCVLLDVRHGQGYWLGEDD